MIEDVTADEAIDAAVLQGRVEHLDDGQADARVESQRDVEFIDGVSGFLCEV